MARTLAIIKPVGSILVMIGITVLIIVPTVRTINGIREATIAEHGLLEQRYQRGRILHRVLKEFAAVRDELAALRSRVPSSTRALEYIEHIERIANAHGLTETVTIAEPTAAPSGSAVAGIPITIEFRGTFPNATAGLRAIEQLPVPLRVTTLAYRTDGTTAAAAPVVLHIEGELPWSWNLGTGI